MCFMFPLINLRHSPDSKSTTSRRGYVFETFRSDKQTKPRDRQGMESKPLEIPDLSIFRCIQTCDFGSIGTFDTTQKHHLPGKADIVACAGHGSIILDVSCGSRGRRREGPIRIKSRPWDSFDKVLQVEMHTWLKTLTLKPKTHPDRRENYRKNICGKEFVCPINRFVVRKIDICPEGLQPRLGGQIT